METKNNFGNKLEKHITMKHIHKLHIYIFRKFRKF